MLEVKFLPSEISVEVSDGALISDAAVKAGLEELHLPCAGKGTCGRCTVDIVDEATGKTRQVLACQTRVQRNLTVKIADRNDDEMRVLGDSRKLIDTDLIPTGASVSPLYRAEILTVPPASIEEHYSDWQRLVRELSKANGTVPVTTSAVVLRKLAETLREQDGLLTVVIREDDSGLHVCDVSAGESTIQTYGAAIDIGTTTVAVQLVDLANGRVIASRTSYNAQISRGGDVISRIDYARNAERQEELRDLILGTLNELLEGAKSDSKVSSEDVKAAFIAGNTTMIHLLLALPPRFIRETPYVPTVNTVPTLSASEVGLSINPDAVVACAPGVGSYVGGDITAGLLCSDIPFNNEEVHLFLDIGTNGEIVLGNSDWMVTCACSAGPAFEGSGIKCGMRATEGAIEWIEISADGSDVKYGVIGDDKPQGICGSGLICLLGELLVNGIIDQSGRFHMDLPTNRLIKSENSNAFVLEWGEKTADGCDLVITEGDIENLMRTKAAIYAACDLILGNVGLDWSAISKVYIAGGFGRYIQIEDAVLIGLLPDLPKELFSYIGNSALTGAYIALLSREKRSELAQIASKMTYIDLSSDPKYMDSYMSAMFLPHTDINLFPSVMERINSKKMLEIGS